LHGKFTTLSYENIETLVEFHSVSLRKYKILHPTKGSHEYLPLVFDDTHACLAHVMVSTSLVNLTYKTKNNPAACLAEKLFTDKNGKLKPMVGALETSRIYDRYIEPLENTLTDLKKYYLIIISKIPTRIVERPEFAEIRSNFAENVASHDPVTI
jgi:hypothetical protein